MITHSEEYRSLMFSMELDQSFLEKLDLLGSWGVLATDQAISVTFWNGWLEKYSGFGIRRRQRPRLLQLFPDLAHRQMDRYFRQVLEGQSFLLSMPCTSIYCPCRRRLEMRALVTCSKQSASCRALEQGVVHGVLCLIEDVTERVASGGRASPAGGGFDRGQSAQRRLPGDARP